MFYAVLKEDEQEKGYMFYSWGEYHNRTFSPEVEQTATIDFTLHGKTYSDRKESLESIALEWSAFGNVACLAWEDLANLSDFFFRNGKRYGMLSRFRENGFC